MRWRAVRGSGPNDCSDVRRCSSGAQRAKRQPPRRSWGFRAAGRLFTMSIGRIDDSPTSTTSSSAPAASSSLTRRTGRASLTATGGILRQNGRSREKFVASGADAALAIAELVAPYADHVVPVLCFVGQADVEGWCRDVMVCSTDNLTRMLLTRPVVLSADHSTDARFRLEAQLRSAVAPPASIQSTSARGRGRAPSPIRSAPSRGHRRDGRNNNLVLKLLVSMVALVAFVVIGPAIAMSIGQVISGVLTRELTSNGACEVEASASPSGAALAPKERTREAPSHRRKRLADDAANKRGANKRPKSQASQAPAPVRPSPSGTSESC